MFQWMHAAARCQHWLLVSAPGRDELPWLPCAPSSGLNSPAPYSGFVSACSKIQRPKELPVQAPVLSSCRTNRLCETCSCEWCPRGGLWPSLMAEREQVKSSAFLCSKMSSSWQQMEREQLLVLSSAGAAGYLLRTPHNHSHTALM